MNNKNNEQTSNENSKSEQEFEKIKKSIRDIIDKKDLKSDKEDYNKGKSLRKDVPRSSHSQWAEWDGRPDPVSLLEQQGERRVQELLPVRYERMGESAFTFYRGAALIMANDLAHTPRTGIEAQICGDAHVSNFGIFATTERSLTFDINDFDETARGPWEWDVKRLAASLEICGRYREFSDDVTKTIVKNCVKKYRDNIKKYAKMPTIDVWFYKAKQEDVKKALSTIDEDEKKAGKKLYKKASKKNNSRAVKKFTETIDGEVRIISEPPIIVPLRDMVKEKTESNPESLFDPQKINDITEYVFKSYIKSIPPDIQYLLKQYEPVDMARKVVGVGSVGTRVWIVVCKGKNKNDYIVLQIKEAEESVINQILNRKDDYPNGKRVIEGQHSIQITGDPLLGWTDSIKQDGDYRHYYVRQLWDCKGSVNLDTISESGLEKIAELCGACLAHAHARTGNRFKIAGYIGKSDVFVDAIVDFANAYADQNEKDYQKFMEKYGK